MNGSKLRDFRGAEGTGAQPRAEDSWGLEQLRRRRRLLQKIREAERFPEPYDVIWPAQAIDRFLNAVRKEGKTQDDVKEALQAHGTGVSHWERLRIDHSKSPSDAKAELVRRTGSDALIKKVQPYVWLLEGCAHVLKRCPDSLVYEAFENSSFPRQKNSDTPEPVGDLSWLLEETARAVIEREALQDFFQQARRTCAEYDPVSGDIFPWRGPALVSLYFDDPETGGFVNKSNPVWESWPAFPRVPLLRVHRHTLDGQIFVSSGEVAPATKTVQEVARLASPIRFSTWDMCPQSLEGFKPIPAEIDMYSETRLVIGPRDSVDQIGLMFECGTFIRLKTEGRERPLTFPYAIDPISAMDCSYGTTLEGMGIGFVAALFDDCWRRVAGFGKGLEKPEIELIDGTENCESRLTWLPVNVHNLAKFLKAAERGDYLLTTDGPLPAPSEIWLRSLPLLQVSIQTRALADEFLRSCLGLKSQPLARLNESRIVGEGEISQYLESLAKWKRTGPISRRGTQ